MVDLFTYACTEGSLSMLRHLARPEFRSRFKVQKPGGDNNDTDLIISRRVMREAASRAKEIGNLRAMTDLIYFGTYDI